MVTVVMLLAVVGLWLLYWFPIRRWYKHWGVTDAEVKRRMSGDLDIPDPTYEAMLAITIAARPEHIWPWLVQMGARRGGLYSYDWLDQLFGFLDGPSAERIVPEFQRLAVGDVIPIGGASGSGFPVKDLDPLRTLLLGGKEGDVQWTWQFGLYPIDERGTRLISRNRARVPRTIRDAVFMRVLEPAGFIMTRKMLLGLKRRAEALAAKENAGAKWDAA
jgi:hypothetical protein